MIIETKTLAYLQHILLNALCKDRTPSEVLRQYLKCGYNKYTLSSHFYSYDKRFRFATCAPVSLLPHPFVTACVHGNIPVVRLFLLLGANPKYCLMEGKQSPLEAFQDNPEMYAVLSEDTPMLARRFSKELAMVMKGQVEKCLLKGNYGQLFTYGMQGLKVTDSNIVFTRQFSSSPMLLQAFVFRMLMTPRRRKAIAGKITRKNGSDAVPPVLRRAVENDGSKGREKLEKLLVMINLLPEETVRTMAHSLLTMEEKTNDTRESRNLWPLIEELGNGIYDGICAEYMNHASQYNVIPKK